MQLQILNPLIYGDWDDLVQTYPGNSFFHSSSWLEILSKTYRYKPFYFTLVEKGKLSFLLPVMEVKSLLTGKRGVSLPFSDYCPIYAREEGLFAKYFTEIIDFGKRKKWKFLELRGGSNCLEEAPYFSSYYLHRLKLAENEELIYHQLKNSTRRNVKNAVKNGVETRIEYSYNAVKRYYNLHCFTRKRHGVPPQPFNFFRNIFKYVISQKKGFVAEATIDNQIIASAMFFVFGNEVLYKFGASDMRYLNLRANNLVMWHAIKWSIDNGFKFFNLGRTDLHHAGLRRFKNGWGPTETLYKYFRYDFRKNGFQKQLPSGDGISNKIFRKMPVFTLKTFGAIFYKHMG